MGIVIDETSLFETIISIALYGGAIFQFVCIFAVMALPEDELDSSDQQEYIKTRGNVSNVMLNRKGKREKKKHR